MLLLFLPPDVSFLLRLTLLHPKTKHGESIGLSMHKGNFIAKEAQGRGTHEIKIKLFSFVAVREPTSLYFPTSAVGDACSSSVLASSAIAQGLGYGALYLE